MRQAVARRGMRVAMALLTVWPTGGNVVYAGTTSTQTTLVENLAYDHPEGLAVDNRGVIYIADTGNKRLEAIGPDRSQVATVGTGLKHPSAVAVGAGGTVYILDVGVGVVVVRPDGHQSTLRRNLDSAVGMAVGRDGSLSIANPFYEFAQIRPDGTKTVRKDPSGGLTSFDTDHAVSLAVDSRGPLYLADGHTLLRISPLGRATDIHTRLSNPQWVAVGANDTLYVAGQQQDARAGGPSLVVRIPKDGHQTDVGTGPNLPIGLAVDRQDAVYFIDGVSGHLLRIGHAGRAATFGPLAVCRRERTDGARDRGPLPGWGARPVAAVDRRAATGGGTATDEHPQGGCTPPHLLRRPATRYGSA